ncbi:hypothetical protein [Shewanella japonica]|uniref:hypothetical protein n=1 Tax=Shewanella japonica TaxID=93973 RepID=UPI002494196D|nr:hypothetical protein [Shewanella japonica]
MEILFISNFLFMVFLGFCILFPLLIYIHKNYIAKVEAELEDVNIFSFNLITTGHGCLHYASVFMFDWYAKRHQLQDKRKSVAADLQRPFKIYFILFTMLLLSVLLMGLLLMLFPDL